MTKTDWISIAKGAGIAAAGAALTYLTQYVSGHDLGLYGPIVAAALAVAVNALRKFATSSGTDG